MYCRKGVKLKINNQNNLTLTLIFTLSVQITYEVFLFRMFLSGVCLSTSVLDFCTSM